MRNGRKTGLGLFLLLLLSLLPAPQPAGGFEIVEEAVEAEEAEKAEEVEEVEEVEGIEVTVTPGNGNPASAEKQPGESGMIYYVALPYGSDVSKVKLKIDLPEGAAISPPLDDDTLWDFTKEPHNFTVTLKSGREVPLTVQVAVQPLAASPGRLVMEGKMWTMTGRRRSDGSYAVTVDAPLLGEERTNYPRYPSRIYVHLLGISDASPSIRQGYGENVPVTSALPEPCLRISGTANIAQMESFSVSKIDFSYEDEPEVLYAQEFNPFVTYAMIERDIDRVPDGGASVAYENDGGCNAGFGVFALAVAIAVMKKR